MCSAQEREREYYPRKRYQCQGRCARCRIIPHCPREKKSKREREAPCRGLHFPSGPANSNWEQAATSWVSLLLLYTPPPPLCSCTHLEALASTQQHPMCASLPFAIMTRRLCFSCRLFSSIFCCVCVGGSDSDLDGTRCCCKTFRRLDT